jgi:predicted phosphoribosyltransferase
VYFISRYELGKTLASKVQHLRGSEPIIVNLKDSGLLTAISVASKVRGWVYPLLTERLVIPGDDRIIGLINQDGELCYNPSLSKFEIEDLEINNQSTIQEASREAFGRLNRRISEYGFVNKDALRGRTVVIVGDIIKDELEIGAARDYLKTVAINRIISLVGNISPDSSTLLYLESDESSFLDIVPNMFDDSHYFEHSDQYSIEDQRKLALNISQYWT